MLRQVAGRLAGRLRGHDLLGRYGGEEFCVVAPDTDTGGALTLAESLRETIASAPFNTECGELSISISIGISHSPPNIRRELKEVLIEADAALYTAKHTGRNRVVCFGDGNAWKSKALSFPLGAVGDTFHLRYALAAAGKKTGVVDRLTAAFDLAPLHP